MACALPVAVSDSESDTILTLKGRTIHRFSAVDPESRWRDLISGVREKKFCFEKWATGWAKPPKQEENQGPDKTA